MSNRTQSVFIFSMIGILKFSFFLYLFCFSGFFFSKSDGAFHLNGIKPFKPKKRVLALGFLGNPLEGVASHRKSFDLETPTVGAKEAEVLRFVLKYADKISPSDAIKLAGLIAEECENYDVDPFLVLAVIQIESRFSPKAVSNRGAVGLMQVMPATAKYVAKKSGITLQSSKSLYDPFLNVRLGIYYLYMLNNRFSSVERVLTAYNFGPNRSILGIRNLERRPPDYVKKVLSFKNRLLQNARIIVAEES